MIEPLFLFELLPSILLIRDSAVGVTEMLLRAALEGRRPEGAPASLQLPDPDEPEGNPLERFEKDSVAVLPLRGMMMKYDSWWGYGCDTLAGLIRLADRSANIAGVVLSIDTPGGTTSSLFKLEDALRTRTKPCIALVEDVCCSAGLYAAALCDEIYAIDPHCETGSIGSCIRIVDTREADKKWGYRIETIYAPESKYKHVEVREALDGNPDRLKREFLSPAAVRFQNIIKENRPRLDTSVEGILEGRLFYADGAIKNGLIDGLSNLEQAIGRVRLLAEEKKSFYSQFK